MNECDHAIALDGHEFSLWDQRAECPYCHIAELEQENKRITRAWLKIQKREIETDKNIDELRTEANELIDALRSEVSALEIENTSLMAARMEALEIYAGMEGFESKTAPEAYCQRIIEQMAKALLVHEEV